MLTRRKLFAGLSSLAAAMSLRSAAEDKPAPVNFPAPTGAVPQAAVGLSARLPPAAEFIADAPDAVARPVVAKLKGIKSVFDFMTPAQEACARSRDLRVDLHRPLQKAWNWAAANGYGIDLEGAVFKITQPLVMPDGQGYAVNGSGAAFAPDTKGAQIVLYGSGHDCIVQIGSTPKTAMFSTNRVMRGVGLICDTQDGAEYGVKWVHTTFTQDAFYDVRVVKARRGWGLFTGGDSANGEFIHLERCTANFTERFFYMDDTQGAGQSLAHLFVNCGWLGDMRIASHGDRAAFEAGSRGGGFSLVALNFNGTVIRSSDTQKPQDMPQASYLINNGITGHFTAIGGRLEHLNTILDNRMSPASGGAITFQGVDFGGLQSCDRHPAVISAIDSEGGSRTRFEACCFDLTKGGGTQCFNVIPHRFDGGEYLFDRCTVSSAFARNLDKLIVLRLAGQPNSRIAMTGCVHATRGSAFKRIVDKRLENFPFGAGGGRSVSDGSPLAAAGVPSNLLQHPAFGVASNANVAPAPWVHTGGNFGAFAVYPDKRVAEFSSSPLARFFMLSPTASVYQDFPDLRMAGGAELFYAAILEVMPTGHALDRFFQVTIENTETGETYDTVQLYQTAGPAHVFLSAVAAGSTGSFRLRLQAVGNGVCMIRLHHQRVTQKRLSAFVMPAAGQTREFAHLWSANPDSLRVLGRFALPHKDDATGSAAADLADVESDIYLSSVSEQIKFYAHQKWNQLPNQDTGTAPPATGAWPEGWVRWNTARKAGGKMGWTCVEAGSPGVWKAWGAIDD